MKHPKFFLSTLFAAAALSVAPAVPALADGDGTSSSPLSGSISGLNPDSYEGTGGVVYISGITGGTLANGTDNKLTIKSNIDISGDGMKFTDAYSSVEYTFTGTITGNGNWTYSHSGAQKYVFTGSLAGYSGNIDIEFGGSNDRDSYIYFGNGEKAATDTNVSGTGSITLNLTGSTSATGSIVFNYSGYADSTSQAITIGNSSLKADAITFTGSVNYTVSSDLSGSTLTISNTGTTTLNGTVSGFSSVTVAENSTLAISGSVDISSPIENSGTVTLNSDVIFVLDTMSFEGDWSNGGATYTLIEGGTIKLGGNTLTNGTVLSFTTSNVSSTLSTIESATFTYDNGTLTVTVTGEYVAIVNGLNGEGTQAKPYFTYGDGTVSIADGGSEGNIFPSSGTLYLATDKYSFGNSSENVYLNGTLNAACDIVIGAAGVYLTNGTSSHYYNFTGSISGTGNWTHGREGSTGSPAVHYAFAGDLSGWSGDISISTNNSANDIIIYGGTIDGVKDNAVTGVTGVTAATDTNVSGTGAISVVGTVQFNYVKTDGTTTGPSTITIGNSSITANNIIFAGDVTYNVSSALVGNGSSATLTISTTGTVTVSGSISNFDNIVVESGSTLALSGSVDLSSAISNEGTVSLNESVIFALDDLSYEGDWTNGATYTLITGGTINIGGTALESGGTISLGLGNLSSHSSIITSATFNYDGSSLTVTVSSDMADWIILGDGEKYVARDGTTALNLDDKTVYVNNSGTLSADSYASGATTNLGAWISWINEDQSTDGGSYRNQIGSLKNTTIIGSGFLGLAVRYGSGSMTATADLTTVDVSNFSGQFSVVNVYHRPVITQLSGEQWKNVEYIFGTKTAEWANVGSTGSNSLPYYAGTDDAAVYTLALQGDTTFAGVTGTSKGCTIDSHAFNSAEFITVSSSGQTLTIDGSGTYAFYGTLAASGTRANLAMTGTGSQTFGGTNYLQNVTVSAGTLALSGTTNITGSVEVTAGTLELGGEITLSSAISNSGTVVIDSDVVFALGNLTATSGNTYTIISGTGTIYGWDSLDYSNFSISGTTLTSDRQITFGTDGTITIDTSASAHSLTWAGSTGDTWNNNVSGNTVWTNGTGSDYFVNGDSVTFSDGGTYTITISGNVHAATMTVSGGDYTFSTSESDTLTVDTLNMSGGNITFGVDATIGTFNTATDGNAAGKSITLTAGTTLTVGELTNAWGASSFVLNAGSVIDVDSASFAINSVDVTVSGTGTWKANTFSFGNLGNYTFSGITLDVTDMVVSSDSTTVYVTIDGGTADIGTLSLNSDSSITFSGSGTYTVGTMNISGSSTLGGTVTIGSVSDTSSSTFTIAEGSNITITGEFLTSPSTGTNIALEEGAKLTVETLTSDWGTSFTLAEGAVIETTSASFLTGSEDKVSGSGTWKATEFTFGNVGTYIFDGVSLIADTVTLAGSNGSPASLTLTGGATFTIGTYQQTDNQNSIGTSLTIGDNTTVNVTGTYHVSWHQETTTLGDGAVLTVQTEMWFSTASTEELTGGTINAQQLTLSNSTTIASFSNGNLNIGSSGLKNDGSGYFIFGDNLTVGVWGGTDGTNKSWGTTTSSAIQLAGNVTFNTLADESITLSGSVTVAESSTTGTIIKTGAGTLTIAGTATLTNGLTVEQGTFNVTGSVELANTVTLGNSITVTGGAVTIDDGTTFALDTMSKGTSGDYDYYVIISGSGTVSFSGDISSFTLGGNSVSGWTLYNSGDGNLVIYTKSSDSITLTWAGTEGNNTWSTAYADASWTSDSGETHFSTGDSVIFAASTTVNKTVLIGADTITANTVTVTGSGYVLVATNPAAEGEYNLIADKLILDDEDSETSHTFTIAEGTSVQVGDLSETAGQLDLVVNGTLDVTGEITVNTDTLIAESISGSGKLTAKSLTLKSYIGSTLTISVAEAEFENVTVANHGGDAKTAYKTLVIGDGTNETTVKVNDTLLLDGGTSAVEVKADSILEVGTLRDKSGSDTSVFGEGTLIADNITIVANGGNDVQISIAEVQAGTVTISAPTDAGSAGYAAVTISSAKFTATSIEHNSRGSLTVSSADFEVGSLSLIGGTTTTATVSITFAAGANAVIGAIESANTHDLTIENGATLTTGYIYRSGSILNLAVDGELYVEKELEGYDNSTGMLSFGKLTDGTTGMGQTLSGSGTANVYGIEASLGSGYLTISVANLNIGEGGIAKNGSGTLTISGTTIGLYKATTSEISAAVTIGDSGVTFNLNDGEKLTVSGTITGNGLVALTGSGSLVLSGSGSTLTNGLTVSGGSVEISGSATIGGTVTLASTIVNTGTITVADGTAFVIDGMESRVSTGGSTYYEIIRGNGGSLTLSGSYTFTDSSGSLDNWNVYSSDGYLVIYLENETLVWNGTTGDNSWTTDGNTTNWISDSGDTVAFTSGTNVQFTETASEKTVAIAGDIKAGNITVSASGYKFDFSGTATVTTYNLAIEKDASLEISGAGTISAIYSATITGSLALGDNATIDLSAIDLGELTTTANITGSGTIVITGANGAEVGVSVSDDFTGTVRVVSGDLDFEVSQTGGATFEFTSGGSLYVRKTDAKYENDIVVTGEKDTEFHIRTSSATGVELAGSFTSGEGITVEKDGDGSSSITLSGDVNIAGTYRQYQGSTTFTGENITINDINYTADGRNDSNLTIDSSGEVTIGEITMAATSARGSLTLEGSANYTIGTINFTNSGLLVIGDGATVGVESITDTAEVASHITIDGTLTVGEMTFGTGSADSLFNQIDGTGTVIVDALNVGTDDHETSVVVSGVTMVAGSITFGENDNSTYNLYLHDATLGFAGDTTVTGGSNIYLNDSSSSTAATVTINTGAYDASTGTFSDTEGYTVTISSTISGTDTLVKAGAGTLVLAGTNTLSGGITTTGGTLEISGSTTIAGSVDVGASIVNSGTITVADDTIFVINVAEKTDSNTGKTYYELITGSGSGSITLGSDCQFILRGEALPSIYEVYADNGYLVLYSNAVDLLWNGTSSDNTWVADGGSEIWISSGGSGDATKFAEYANVVFTEDAGSTTVNISGTVHVSTATIESGSYTWQNSGSVYGSTLTLADGSSLNAESAYLYFNEIELAGTLTFRYGSDSWDKLTFLGYTSSGDFGGQLFLRDLSKADNTTLTIGEVEVNAAGRIYARYGGTLNLDKITGEGNLTFDAYDNSSSGTTNHIFYINIADLSEYTGTLTFIRTGTETSESNIVTPRGTITAEKWVDASVVVDSQATVILQTTGDSTMQAGHITVKASGTLDVDGTVELSTAITVNANGTVTFGNDAVFVLNSSLITSSDTYTLITGEGTIDGWDKLTYSNFELEGGEVITSARQLDLSTEGQVIVDLTEGAHNLLWDGNATDNVWTSNGSTIWKNTEITGDNDPYDKFVDGDNVTFTSSGYTTVSVSGTVTAGTVTIASDSYTWQNGTVYGDKLTIADGASLNASTSSTTTTYLGFKEIELAGWLNLRAGNASLDKLTFSGEGDGFLFLRDISELGSGRTFTIDEVDVTSDGTISSRYYGTLTIESITGSANLTLNADDRSANNGGTNFTFYVDLLDLSNYSGTIFVTETTNNHSNGATWIQVNISSESWENASVTVGNETTVYLDTDSGSMTAGHITVQSGGTLVIADNMTLDLTAAIDNSGTVTLGEGMLFVLDDALKANDGTYTYTFITGEGTIVDWDKLDYTNFVFSDGSVLVSNRQLISSNNGTIVINPDGTSSPTLVWNGTSDSDVWSTAGAEVWLNSGASDKFWEGDSVLFDETSSYRTVKIEGSFAAGTVTVTDADYTLEFSGGNVVSTKGVTVNDGASLTLAGNGVLAMDVDATISGTVYVESETTIDFTDIDLSGLTAAGSGNITGTGTIYIGAVTNTTTDITLNDNFYGTLKTDGGTLNVSGISGGSNATIEIVAGTMSSDTEGDSNIKFGSNSTLDANILVTGSGDVFIGLDDNGGEIAGTFTSGSGVTVHRVSNNGRGSYTVTFSGEVDIEGSYISFRGKTKFSGGGYIYSLTLRNHGYTDGVTFSGDGMTYTVGTITYAGSSNTGTINFDIDKGVTVNAGTFSASWGLETVNVNGTFNIGTATWTTGGSADTIVGTGTVNIGSLSFGNTGKYTFENVDLNIGSGGITHSSGNSTLTFKNITVGVYSESGATSWSSSADIILAGEITFNTEDGESITLSGTLSGDGASIIKTGEGSLTLSGSNTFTGNVTIEQGTVTVGSSSALGTGSITIGTDTTLASTSGTVTLTDKSFVINGSSTFSGIILAGTMTFDWAAGAVISMTDSASVTGTGSVHFADDTDFTYDGVILFTNTGLSAGNLSGWTASYEGTGSDVFGDGTFKVDSNGNIIFVASDDFLAQYGTLVWYVDGSYTQTWTEGTFQDTEGLSGDRNYLFNEKSKGATSLLTGEISTNRVTIASAAGEIKWAVADGQTTATISGSELIIESGANLWIGTNESKTVALAFEEIKLGGKLSYQSYGDSWGSLEFTDNGAELYIENFQNSLEIGEVVVSADAKISSHWGYWGLGGGSEAYSALKIDTLSGTGDLSITGPTGDLQILAVEVGDMSNYSGTITLSDSDQYSNVVFRLMGSSSSTYELSDITIVVGTGGALDANGQADIGFNTVLAGGTLTSSSSISNTNIQFPTITLTADSSVEAGNGVSFGMVARGYAESDLYLNGNTLTKTGSGTFFLLDTTVWGADEDAAGSTGKLLISEGTIELDGVTVNDTAIVVGDSGKLYIASANGYSSTTLDNLTSSGTVEIGGGATLELVGNTTLTGALLIDSNGTLSITSGAVVDLTKATSQNGGNGILSISGEGSTVKIANGEWGSSSNFGSNMYNGTLQIADGGILEVTAAQSEGTGSGERAFAVTSGTGTYRYSGEGTSYIHSTERNIHLANDATLVFEVTKSDATLNVSMEIANGISTSGDVLGSATTSTGSLQKTGAGTLILSGTNLYSGGTTVSEGELIAKTTTALGSGNIAIEENGTLTLDVGATYTTTVSITGTGTLALAEGTTLSLTGTNFSGFEGTTQISSGAQLSLTGDSTTYTLSSTILGTGSLSIESGTLQIAAEDLSSFKGSTTIGSGATLKFIASTGVEASEFAGTILGSGALVVDEGATLVVNATAIADFEGTTQISSDATLELIIDESFEGTLETTITGEGTLVKSGSGTLTLGNGISVSNVTLTEGTLAGLTLSEGMTATVTGGTLDSFEMTDGDLIISATTSITGSSTTISGGTISLAALYDPTSPYFNVADSVTITIAGEVTFNLSGMDFSSAGKSELVIFDSGVTFDNCSVDDLTLTYDGTSYDDDPHFTGEQNFKWDESEGSLSVTVGMEALDLHWQGSDNEGGNILQTNETGNFYEVYNKDAFFIAGDTIYFDGDGTQAVVQSSVLLGSNIDAAAIYVQNGAEITLDTNSGTYALTGEGGLTVDSTSSLTLKNARHSYTGETKVDGSLTLEITANSGSGQMFASLVSGSGSLTLDIADGLEISIADNLTGTGNQLISGEISFVKSGAGTLVVDAAQTDFSGSVTISAGTMVIASSDLFGENATIAIDEGGTLEISASIDSMTETLSGAGTLLVDGGVTLVTDASNIAGLTGSTLLSDGAALELVADTDVTTTLTSTITGSNATLSKTGEGTVTLADGTSVSTINLTGGTLGNVALSDGMTLTATKGTGLSGISMTAGTLDVSDVFDDPTASITLSGTNSFSGGTINLGNGILLKDGEPVTEPITSAFIITDGTATVSSSILFDLEGVDVPDVVFNEDGERCYTVAYYVFTVENGASLEGWDTNTLLPGNFAIDGVKIDAETSRTRVELASDNDGNAYVEFYITEYDLTWDGGESGVWNTSDEIWTRSAGIEEVYKNGDRVTFSDSDNKLTITIEGGDVTPGSLTVDDDTDVTINGNGNAISNKKGVITIGDNGSLTLTSAGNVMGGGVTIGDNGSLTLKVSSSDEAYLTTGEVALAGSSGTFTIDTDAGVDATYETVLTGDLADSAGLTLSKTGSGTLEITEAHDYESLTVTVSEGTLALTGDGTLGSVDINLAGNATLELSADAETTKDIGNSISGIGSAATIVKTGEGEITVSGDNSGFSGTVEICEGTLTLTSTTALGSVSKTTIADDGTLKLGISEDFDLNDIVGTVSGSGTIEIDLGTDGTIYASSGYYGSDKFTDFTGSFVIDGGADTSITMKVDVSNTSRGSAIGDANVELGENVDLVFNIQNAGYSYGGSISGEGNVSFNWDSTSSASHTFSLTGDNSGFDGTIEIDDIVLTAEGGAALGSEKATVVNNNELWIDEDDKSTVVAKLTGTGNLHKTGSGAVKITNTDNDLSGSLEIREGSLCFAGSETLGGISTASVSEGATFELEVDGEDTLDITVTGEGAVTIHGKDGSCIVPYAIDDDDGYSTDTVTLASNDDSSYNGGFTVDSAYLITSKTSSFDGMNELGTSTVTITNDSTWDASDGGFTASGSRTINIKDHSRLLAGAFSAVANSGGSISISNIRVDTDADADTTSLYINITSSNDISRKYITGRDGTIYLNDVDIYLNTTITQFGQITVVDTSSGLKIDGTPNVYINGEPEAESYWINGVISQDSVSEDVKKNGLSYAAMVVMPTEAFLQDVRTIHSRLEQRRFAFSREGDWEFFAQAQTIQEDSGSSSDSKSFDYYTYGAIVGADVRIDQTTIFGMALAYDHGDAKIHHSQGHIKMDDYRFTAFGSKVFSEWLFVEGGVQAGVGSYDIRRRAGSTVGDNNGDTDGVNVGGFFTFGGVVPITDNVFLTPYIGVSYMYSHVDSFDEEGSYGYKTDDFDANSLRGKIGTQLRAELMLGDTPTALALGLSYAHEFIDDDIDYDVAAITYSDKKQSLTENAFTEDLISISLSAEFGVTDAASVFMGYNADIGLGNSEVSHAVNAGVKVTF